jgi:hypothetical protein
MTGLNEANMTLSVMEMPSLAIMAKTFVRDLLD